MEMITLSSLFNNYQAGDLSGSNLAETLFNTYGDSLTQGLSYSVNFSYTSPNDVTKEVAKSLYRGEFQNTLEPMTQGEGFDASASSPMESATRASSSNANANANANAPSSFNWKKKATDLAAALQKMGLEPGDFGCLKPGTQVGPDYSWRGHSKMVCTRAATHSDPALPEQIGCPPINWPGWRS